VVTPVASAMRTRKDTSCDRKTGRTRKGFEAMFSSSKLSQAARAGGRATRKLAEMSKASRV